MRILQRVVLFCAFAALLTSGNCDKPADPPPPPQAPDARAGSDQLVLVGETVFLDGTLSTVPQGETANFLWFFTPTGRPAASGAQLVNANGATPSFIVDVQGVYVIVLRVTAGNTSDTDTVRVTARSNTTPTAHAGRDTTVNINIATVLDGSGSFDPDGDPIRFQWTVRTTPHVTSNPTLADSASEQAMFVPDVMGIYEIELMVWDDIGGPTSADADSVSITVVRPNNQPPVADAGADTTSESGSSVVVDGANSFDPDGDPLQFLWSMVSTPPGSNATFSQLPGTFALLTPDLDGDYVLALDVTDGDLSDTDSITVTVAPASGAWLAKTQFPGVSRCAPVAFLLGGDGYLMIGADNSTGSCGAALTDVWHFTPQPGAGAGMWTQDTNHPAGARSGNAIGFAVNGKGYLGLGDTGAQAVDMWEFDGNSWTQMASFPGTDPGGVSKGMAIGAKGYVVPLGTNREFWEFDPLNGATGTWTRKADMPVDPGLATSNFVIGDKGYVGTDAPSNNVWRYDATNDMWTQRADFPGAGGPGTAAAFTIGSTGYVNDSSKEMWAYDEAGNAWTRKTDRPLLGTPTYGFAVGGKGYVGILAPTVQALLEYDPAED